MKTGILFDLDGTLLDTLQDLANSVNHTLFANDFPLRSIEEVRAFVGSGARALIAKAAPPEADVEALLSVFQDHYARHCQDKTAPYPGIPQALEALPYPIAIVSNKPDRAVKTLCAQYFPGIPALGETAGLSRKPAPDMVLRAMDELGVERCVYIGDSEVDVQTAKNANAPCISVLWGFRDKEQLQKAGGRIFCERPEDLPQTIARILHGK